VRAVRLLAAVLGAIVVVTACTTGGSASTTGVPPLSVPAVSDSTEKAAAELIYDRVAPSIASIETGISGGSGILIDGESVLTAAHVVWPYRTVRVVFANGAELVDAPVVGVDPFGDLAIVDVSDMSGLPPPVDIGDGEAIPLGRPVYLVGYPGETEAFPHPTITEGILSRTREWAGEGWTFLQSDTTVVGGQSGGALVDETGTVIGLTNFSFLEEFGLSGSLSDAVPKIEQMRAGEDIAQLGDRLPPTGRGTDTWQLTFDNVWQDFVFVLEPPLYSTVSIEASSDADLSLTLNTIDGLEVGAADDTTGGVETIDELVTYRGQYLLRVESLGGIGDARLRSSVDLVQWKDPDDGTVLERDTTIVGNIDYPGDFDWYLVDLGRGQAITVDVDAIAFDPALMIDGPEGDGYVQALDDDSGGGLFGTNPRIVFTARETGTFFIIVADNGSTGPGAYRLTID
jgi:hypothetical protein